MIFLCENGGVYISDCDAEFTGTTFANTDYPSIYCIRTNCIFQDSQIRTIKQNGMTFSNCESVTISNCIIEDIGSSGISISQTKAEITSNQIKNIQGNGVYISESSQASLKDNKVSDCKFPSFAILLNCTAFAENNVISSMEKSGVCIRSAAKVEFRNNKINDVNECGISISDSSDVLLTDCRLTDCRIAAVEAYNSSQVRCKKSTFKNGPYAFLVYSGAYLKATHNTLVNYQKAICQLRFRGKCIVRDNTVTGPKIGQFDGNTTGNYLFENNGMPPVTNIPEEAKRLGITPDPIAEDSHGMCLKCGKNKRNCFFQSCGHCIYCMECGEEALKNKELCPLCRFPIQAFACPHEQNLVEGVCTICLTNQSDAVVLPCGHTGYCYSCLSEWISRNGTCPVCRIEATCKKIHDL